MTELALINLLINCVHFASTYPSDLLSNISNVFFIYINYYYVNDGFKYYLGLKDNYFAFVSLLNDDLTKL